IDKARAKGVIKKNTASRKISRMAKRANKNA
ncbi:MAG: 30S ribosomal protein S20, partial [Faecalibacterium sp.]|nr:30S ribosomal protein S20 [Faecalibacterium prausnitzii]MBD9259545.1 30S ribosomal protein S20 [Faecalibacterium sp.]